MCHTQLDSAGKIHTLHFYIKLSKHDQRKGQRGGYKSDKSFQVKEDQVGGTETFEHLISCVMVLRSVGFLCFTSASSCILPTLAHVSLSLFPSL